MAPGIQGGRMTSDTVILIFPTANVKHVTIKGTDAIQVDTGMTRFQFMEMALRYAAGNEPIAVMTKEGEE